jgi:transglutaminase-like putative cysteine protease
MNQRRQISLIAAAATLLATAPMVTLFQTLTWFIDCLLAVVTVCGTALLSRSLRAPLLAQIVAMLVTLTMLVTLLFGTDAYAGLIPSAGTWRHFNDLLVQAGIDIREMSAPVPERTGLLFLVTLGIGAVAVLVDLFVVGLRQPALAGMPMLPLYSIPVIIREDVSFIPFIIGAIGYLWLLASDNVDRVRRFGRRFTSDGRDVDLWEPSPLAAAGQRLAVVGVLLAILLPLAVPGMSGGLFDTDGGGGGEGVGNGRGRPGSSVNLFATLSGSLNQDHKINMIKVITTDPSPYYLRFGVADQLVANGFRSRVPTGGQSLTFSGISGPSREQWEQHGYHAEIQVLDFTMPLLPLYTDIANVSNLDRNWRYDSTGELLYSTRENSAKVKSYSLDYVRPEYSMEALRQAADLPPSNPLQQYAAVPPVPYVAQLVSQLTTGKTSEYDKVRALYEYFSTKNNFTYAVNTKTGTSGSEIVDFLINKSGYCEQYAAALAWLVRQAGYPARVAFGFARGQGRTGDTYTLTNLDLHAWTEVYFHGYGWVPFDATPSVGLAGPVSTEWAPNVDQPDPPNQPGGTGTAPGGDASDAPGGPNSRRNPSDGPSAGVLTSPASSWPIWLLCGFVVLLVLLAQPALRRTVLRRGRDLGGRGGLRRLRMGRHGPATTATTGAAVPGQLRVVVPEPMDADRRRAHAAWDELLDTLIDYGITTDDAETPRVTVERLTTRVRLSGAAGDGARLLARVEERARYARSPLDEPGLDVAVRDVRRGIAGYVTRGVRIRAVLMPPSVLRRWRSRIGDAYSAIAAASRNGERLSRSLSPRRLLPRRR